MPLPSSERASSGTRAEPCSRGLPPPPVLCPSAPGLHSVTAFSGCPVIPSWYSVAHPNVFSPVGCVGTRCRHSSAQAQLDFQLPHLSRFSVVIRSGRGTPPRQSAFVRSRREVHRLVPVLRRIVGRPRANAYRAATRLLRFFFRRRVRFFLGASEKAMLQRMARYRKGLWPHLDGTLRHERRSCEVAINSARPLQTFRHPITYS